MMAQIWADVRDDPNVRVVIVTGEGERHFCTGIDVREAAATGGSTAGMGPARDETQTAYRIPFDLPGPERLFRVDSEEALFQRMSQEARERKPEELVFNSEKQLSQPIGVHQVPSNHFLHILLIQSMTALNLSQRLRIKVVVKERQFAFLLDE